jgi:hypothetical protein
MDRDPLAFAAAVVVFYVALIGLCMWFSAATCASQARRMGLAHSWGPLQDCMVMVDDRWEPMGWQSSVRIKR